MKTYDTLRTIGGLSNGNLLFECSVFDYNRLVMGTVGFIDPAEIGGRLKLYRKANGHTQQQLADLIGISRNRISQIENEENPKLKLKTYIKLVRCLYHE